MNELEKMGLHDLDSLSFLCMIFHSLASLLSNLIGYRKGCHMPPQRMCLLIFCNLMSAMLS